ncbi:MAG: heat-inducible transcription repressor HrcA [Syntrophothermus sp.]|uniref:heat-inducible transcriptional repressor HrcA n=1 Tax=Syntrophothermus sp. TaxID=2736299 RepID=UPI00257C60B9|nr:heat-inducible transcriptional repressor HrcA [Syntrophothermus sp.]NSW83278.1 heat-inducible transcription repressor HrcA [Syntrophothermus sp.]
MVLDERKKLILEAIIKDYVETAEPVGSRSIVRKHQLGVSPATVRNEMADLEEMGFLEQPHTSAGRIPSQLGFRYYVDCMMEKEELAENEKELLHRVLSDRINDIFEVIRRTGVTLSQFTRYASFVISGPIKVAEIKSVQLVPMQKGTALVVLVTSSGVILHKLIDTPESIQAHDLEKISAFFTRGLAGVKLGELSRTSLKSLRDELLSQRKAIDRVLEAIDELLQASDEEKVLISGAINMLNEPEFRNPDKLKTVLGILEENSLFKKVLNDPGPQEVRIKIGRENEVEEIQELSLVFTSYEINGQEMGKIGLIGPVRMQYWRAAGLVESFRDVVEDVIRKLMM